jgi:large subunit ribosomal protein L18e
MGIDLGLRSRLKNKNTRHITTPNPYLRLAHKLYTFLARRTDSKFNDVVAKRL